jgi:hypothetical protein
LVHIRPGTAEPTSQEAGEIVTARTSEPEVFESTGRIEECDRDHNAATPEVPIPPLPEATTTADGDDRPVSPGRPFERPSPGPATEPPD